MTRLCHLITRADSIGGAQVHVLEISRRLRLVGLDVSVLSGPSGVFSQELERQGVPHVELPHLVRAIGPINDVRGYREIVEALGRLRPDLVMLHSSKAGWLGRLACKRLGIPAVFTAHGWAFTEGTNPVLRQCYRFAEWLAGRWADRVITVSDYDRNLAIRNRVLDEETVVTVHNGVQDVTLARAPAGRQPPKIIVVARMDVPKEHALLLDALASLAQEAWTLELIGDGPHRAALEAQAKALGIADRVQFLGSRNDVAERLADAQLFILPSRWEGLPRSILEAMRAGLPVIASDVGGIPECVEHGVTGYRVPRGSVEEMARHIQMLLRDPQRRAEMGAAGRGAYERQFTLARMLRQTLAVIGGALEKRGKNEAAQVLASLAAQGSRIGIG
jgi:glycosyltransferase involved in cell wall biosynthesis